MPLATQEPRSSLRRDLMDLLALQSDADIERLRSEAEDVLLQNCGDQVSLRGLIEFSNICSRDCYYCGIRKSHLALERYQLDEEAILAAATWCAERGFGSLVLQSGERNDRRFIDGLVALIQSIKQHTRSARLPDGLGITLSIGEQSPIDYARLFDAGAHRYLLRIETSSPRLFAALHPPSQTYATRMVCLSTLKSIGYQVGTGVMIGLPGQTLADLADDLLFFSDFDIDMLGMGPYIPHAQTPLAGALIPSPATRLGLSLKMIAVARLLLPDINIAASTALQVLAADGREQGLRFGANVFMPQITPPQVRHHYALYDDKPCIDEDAEQCAACFNSRIAACGRRILHDAWGDAPRYANRITARPS